MSKGSVFTAELSHLEWLGHEQYGYIEFEPDEKVRRLLSDLAADMDADELRPQVVTTLSAESRVRPGQPVELWVDTSRIHIFDPESGENLTRDAEAGAELTRLAGEERERELSLARERDEQNA
jgi:multiple sugar transport system ATP-binding protein